MVLSSQVFFFLRKLEGGGGGRRASQSFGYLNYQCFKLPGTGYRMGIPYRAYHTVSSSKLRRHSTNVRHEYSLLLFIKAFISV